MKLIEILLKEVAMEAATTRKMLAIVPEDKYDWKPHPKSMSVQPLATHIAECFGMIKTVLTTGELDFAAKPYEPTIIKNNVELTACLEKNIKEAEDSLTAAKEEDLWTDWVMKSGATIFMTSSKYEAIRHMLCQITHHRAQLGVFMRLLDVRIPGSYGPSADEMENFV